MHSQKEINLILVNINSTLSILSHFFYGKIYRIVYIIYKTIKIKNILKRVEKKITIYRADIQSLKVRSIHQAQFKQTYISAFYY